MNKRIISLAAAVLFIAVQLCAALPASAIARQQTRFNTPAGYNDHDFQKLVAFLELTDENGVRNGEKMVAPFNGYYIPTYPESWSYYYYDYENGALYMWGVFWSEPEDGSESRVVALELYGMDLVGALDFSGCVEMSEVYCDYNRITSLNASDCSDMRALTCSYCGIKSLSIKGCAGLDLFDCSHNGLSELDASGCYTLYDIECNDNNLTALNVTGCTNLGWLDCFNNSLTELDLTDCPQLYVLNCSGNPIKDIALSPSAELTFEHISAAGSGTVSYAGASYSTETASASPDPGAEFLGWYSEDGQFISNSLELNVRACGYTRLTARFSSDFLPGDADGDGAVTALDALAVLRYALGLVQDIAPEADVNGDGFVNANDALLILRYTLGLTTL